MKCRPAITLACVFFAASVMQKPAVAANYTQNSQTGQITITSQPAYSARFDVPQFGGIHLLYLQFDSPVSLIDLEVWGENQYLYYLDGFGYIRNSTINSLVRYENVGLSDEFRFLFRTPSDVNTYKDGFAIEFSRWEFETAYFQITPSKSGVLNYRITEFFVPRVPEPETWGMFILGFGLIGTSLRAKRTFQRVWLGM